MVRAKFKCTEKSDQVIKLDPVTYGSKENEEFFRYTPGGQISLYGITNQKATDAFEVGKEYYVDFTKADS